MKPKRPGMVFNLASEQAVRYKQYADEIDTWLREKFAELAEFAVHDRDCVAGQCHGGRPTDDGGYERCYGYGSNEKWYPRGEYPPCTCGLTALLKEILDEDYT